MLMNMCLRSVLSSTNRKPFLSIPECPLACQLHVDCVFNVVESLFPYPGARSFPICAKSECSHEFVSFLHIFFTLIVSCVMSTSPPTIDTQRPSLKPRE